MNPKEKLKFLGRWLNEVKDADESGMSMPAPNKLHVEALEWAIEKAKAND